MILFWLSLAVPQATYTIFSVRWLGSNIAVSVVAPLKMSLDVSGGVTATSTGMATVAYVCGSGSLPKQLSTTHLLLPLPLKTLDYSTYELPSNSFKRA